MCADADKKISSMISTGCGNNLGTQWAEKGLKEDRTKKEGKRLKIGGRRGRTGEWAVQVRRKHGTLVEFPSLRVGLGSSE